MVISWCILGAQYQLTVIGVLKVSTFTKAQQACQSCPSEIVNFLQLGQLCVRLRWYAALKLQTNSNENIKFISLV